MSSSTTLSRLSSLLTTSSSLPSFTRTVLSSHSSASSCFLLPSRSYEKLTRRPPPRRSHAFFQQLAEERRTQPPPPNTSAALTYTPPQPPLTVYHHQYHNEYFTRTQLLEKQHLHTNRTPAPSDQSLDASPTPDQSIDTQPPTVFAIVELNGAQHKVVQDDLIMCDSISSAPVNTRIALDNVLLLGSVEWSVIGRPVVPGASVECVVEEHAQTDKVLVFHKKRRKNHRKMRGYRGDVTVLRVTKITVPAIEPDTASVNGGERKQLE